MLFRSAFLGQISNITPSYVDIMANLLSSVFGGLARGTNATNLLDLGSRLRLAANAASAAVGFLEGFATWIPKRFCIGFKNTFPS